MVTYTLVFPGLRLSLVLEVLLFNAALFVRFVGHTIGRFAIARRLLLLRLGSERLGSDLTVGVILTAI